MKRAMLAIGACAALQAWGQPAPATEPSLRPVVVTPAPGNEQAAFDTPASVDVIPGEALRDGQLGINLSESLARVPGVTALNRQNYAQDIQVSSRGYGARSTFGVRGLRLYTDGIPATAPDGQSQVSHFDLFAADRIEVLRGPFSALYGNSSGGVISLFTADGGPGTVATLDSAAGSDGVQRHNLRLSGEQGAVHYNLSATRFDTDGWRAHSAAGRTGFNGKLKWTASAGTRVTLVLNGVEMPGVQDPMGLTRAELQADPRQASPAALQFDARKSVRQSQAGVILEQRLGAQDSLKLTGWSGSRATLQFQAIPVAVQAPITHPGGVIDLDRRYDGLDGQWTHRTRLAGAPLVLTAGLSAERLLEHRRGFQNFVGTQLGVQGALRRDEDNRVRTSDQYLQGVWSGADWSLTAGVRHSRLAFDSRDRFLANGDGSGEARFSATTPVLGVVWHASEALNLYASAGRGFETPTFNELAYRPGGAPGLNFDLRPATSRQLELGAKAELARGWHGAVAVFQALTRDELVVLSNSGGRSTFQNAGRTRRRGLEASLEGTLARDLTLSLALTWLDARYAGSFLTCVAAPCSTPTALVGAGNRIPGIPRANAWAELAWRHRPSGLDVALELRATGAIVVDDLNTDAAPGSAVVNLRAGLSQQVGRWSLREFVRVDNVANRRSVGSVIVNEANARFFEPAPGRTWLAGVTAAYRF